MPDLDNDTVFVLVIAGGSLLASALPWFGFGWWKSRNTKLPDTDTKDVEA